MPVLLYGHTHGHLSFRFAHSRLFKYHCLILSQSPIALLFLPATQWPVGFSISRGLLHFLHHATQGSLDGVPVGKEGGGIRFNDFNTTQIADNACFNRCARVPPTKPNQRRSNEDQPPSIKGVEWSKNRSGGWDCRKFRELPGGKVTDRQYLGYLGKRR